MCHLPLNNANFWIGLSAIDQEEVRDCQVQCCPYCGGKLQVSNYPRKPQGSNQLLLGGPYQSRWCSCCACDGYRCTTPAFVRFLGRKVHLGIVITLISAVQHELTPVRRQRLIEELNLCPQSVYR